MIVTRVKEGKDLKKFICDYVAKNNLKNAAIICADGKAHIHISISDKLLFTRELDNNTGFDELVIQELN